MSILNSINVTIEKIMINRMYRTGHMTSARNFKIITIFLFPFKSFVELVKAVLTFAGFSS